MIHSSCFNVSSHNELIDTFFVVQVTILALSIWIISVSCFLAGYNYPKQQIRIRVLG